MDFTAECRWEKDRSVSTWQINIKVANLKERENKAWKERNGALVTCGKYEVEKEKNIGEK